AFQLPISSSLNLGLRGRRIEVPSSGGHLAAGSKLSHAFRPSDELENSFVLGVRLRAFFRNVLRRDARSHTLSLGEVARGRGAFENCSSNLHCCVWWTCLRVPFNKCSPEHFR